jgi:chromodomain-helicase-DNA-binding protein 1
VGARRNIPTKKQRQRQQAVAAGREPPSQAEVRFSVRRSAQVANYNEEEDEDEFVEDDDDMTPNYWATAPEDTGPVIDKILDHRVKDGLGKASYRSFMLSCAD